MPDEKTFIVGSAAALRQGGASAVAAFVDSTAGSSGRAEPTDPWLQCTGLRSKSARTPILHNFPRQGRELQSVPREDPEDGASFNGNRRTEGLGGWMHPPSA